MHSASQNILLSLLPQARLQTLRYDTTVVMSANALDGCCNNCLGCDQKSCNVSLLSECRSATIACQAMLHVVQTITQQNYPYCYISTAVSHDTADLAMYKLSYTDVSLSTVYTVSGTEATQTDTNDYHR